MNRTRVLALLLAFMLASCCAAAEGVGEDKANALLHRMMELDRSVSVNEYNSTVARLCEEADTDVFSVMGKVLENAEPGSEEYDFVTGTLDYSASTLFGEPYAVGFAWKLKTQELSEYAMSDLLPATHGGQIRFVQEQAEALTFLGTIVYFIHFTVANGDAMTIEERDGRIAQVMQAVQHGVDEIGIEALMRDDAKSTIVSMLSDVARAQSDERMEMRCTLSTLDLPGEPAA